MTSYDFNDCDDWSVSDNSVIKEYISIKGKHRLKITKQNGEKKNLHLFTTRFTPGSKIRCASTGHFYPDYKVGSSDEDLFFKVCLSGYLPESSYGKFLYYSSPEEYEYHFHAKVCTKIKDSWKQKFDKKVLTLDNQTSTPTYVN